MAAAIKLTPTREAVGEMATFFALAASGTMAVDLLGATAVQMITVSVLVSHLVTTEAAAPMSAAHTGAFTTGAIRQGKGPNSQTPPTFGSGFEF